MRSGPLQLERRPGGPHIAGGGPLPSSSRGRASEAGGVAVGASGLGDAALHDGLAAGLDGAAGDEVAAFQLVDDVGGVRVLGGPVGLLLGELRLVLAAVVLARLEARE